MTNHLEELAPLRQKGWLHRLDQHGAVLRDDQAAPVRGYSGALRLKFRLPIGFWATATARVVGRNRERDGWQLEFLSVSAAEREMLTGYLASRRDVGELCQTEIETIYDLRTEASSLVILLSGHLGVTEAGMLSDELASLRQKRPTFVLLNATHFTASASGALQQLRRGLEVLKHEEVAGVFTTPSSVAEGQLRRAIREAGLGEALVSFSNPEEALRFWKGLVGASAGSSRHLPSARSEMRRFSH